MHIWIDNEFDRIRMVQFDFDKNYISELEQMTIRVIIKNETYSDLKCSRNKSI